MKVGFVVEIAESVAKGRGSAGRYTAIREQAKRAEDSGYDSIWVYDHLLFRHDEVDWTVGIWEAWTVMSALAEATERVEIGSLVLCNQFRNPAILAKMAHTLDEVSDGRLILGIGAGWNRPEFDAFGIPFDHRASRLEEALQIIRPLLREGRVDFAGDYYTVRDCEITPRSPRRNGPPLMVGAFSPRTIRLTVRYADQWNTGFWATPEDAEPQLALFQEAVAEVQPEVVPEVTIVAGVAFRDLLDVMPSFETTIDGDPAHIAEAMAAHEAAGVSHLQLSVVPSTDEAFGRVEEALAIWRA